MRQPRSAAELSAVVESSVCFVKSASCASCIQRSGKAASITRSAGAGFHFSNHRIRDLEDTSHSRTRVPLLE
jgi:hypothetical protein